jgi:hypothetical protein
MSYKIAGLVLNGLLITTSQDEKPARRYCLGLKSGPIITEHRGMGHVSLNPELAAAPDREAVAWWAVTAKGRDFLNGASCSQGQQQKA